MEEKFDYWQPRISKRQLRGAFVAACAALSLWLAWSYTPLLIEAIQSGSASSDGGADLWLAGERPNGAVNGTPAADIEIYRSGWVRWREVATGRQHVSWTPDVSWGEEPLAIRSTPMPAPAAHAALPIEPPLAVATETEQEPTPAAIPKAPQPTPAQSRKR